MAKISRIEPKIPALKKRAKVAVYARVSMETDRLAHSLSAQVSYYNGLIQSNPEWEYAGVYADFGISGTRTAARSEFLRLIADCEAGKVDIVLTKSISRFARNTVDLLSTVRHLKEIGVEVRFEKERIHSYSGDGELMLSILASFAQEESRSISENCKWGIRKRFQSGEIGTANKHLLGYRYDEEKKKYVIIPEEAEAVRWMFRMYIEGVSLRDIAGNLNRAGIRSVLGNEFTESTVRQMIFNEVYAGDIRRQKCFMEDPITKNKVKNDGQLPQYYMADCHEAIIDRGAWAKVQEERKRRAASLNPVYPFTGKIKCGICGCHYTRRSATVKGREYVSWFCRAKKEKGVTCQSRNYSEEQLQRICAGFMGTDAFDAEAFGESVRGLTVLPDGSLEAVFLNGETKVWEAPPEPVKLRCSRHENTSTEEFTGKIWCASCGNLYHKYCCYGKYTYWRCSGKSRVRTECGGRDFQDSDIRKISAYLMGMEEFDGAEFEKQVQEFVALEDGSLACHFYGGKVRKWQRT